jgi:L-fuculose-phosphate aldolase
MADEAALRREMIEIGRRLAARGLVAASDGNLSCRAGAGRLLITARGAYLGALDDNRIVAVDETGRPAGGGASPSTEIALHLEVYQSRPDVGAAVHAHPPTATAFSYAGVSLAEPVIPEVVATLGSIPTAPYATPSSEEGPAAIRELIRTHDALILERHGALTVGGTLREAYYRMEKVEHAAQVLLIARQLGGPRPLSADELVRLERMCRRLGLGWRPAER